MRFRQYRLPVLGLILIAALWLPIVPAWADKSLLPAQSPVRNHCATCHHTEADERIPRIESLRTTPYEWKRIVDRMIRVHMKMKQMPPPPEADRKRIITELANRLPLSPGELTRVAYLSEGATFNIEEPWPNDKIFQQTCLGCHSYGKILSYRRTAESWAKLKDFHVGMMPVLLLIFGEYDWPATAAHYLQQLARQLPMETADWKRWRELKNKPKLAGSWYVSGSQPVRGDYDGSLTFVPQSDGTYLVNRLVLYEDGSSQRWSGRVTLYAGHLAQGELNGESAATRLTVTLAPNGATADGRWYLKSQSYVYGLERYYRNVSKAGRIVRVSPRALYRLAPPESLTIKMVNVPARLSPQDISFGDKAIRVRSVKRVNAHTLEVGIQAGDRVAVGAKEVRVGEARAPGLLVVADKINYIKIAPPSALARLGGIKFPKGGVQFVARAYANGQDGRHGTKDDLYLGAVKVSWTLEPYHVTNFDASRLDLVGQIDGNGLFLPADEGINPASPTHSNTGRVWVVAHYRPSPASRELMARAYMLIAFPDFNRAVD